MSKMQASDYVKLITSKATELSIPRQWLSSANLRQQLTQMSQKGSSTRPRIDGRMIEHCAVVGGGVMGQGIVISLLKAGFRTTLIERDEQTLAQRMADIWQSMADDLQKGRVTKLCISQAAQLLHASTDFEALKSIDFVIEAVFENMALKLDVFRTLDRVCPAHAILCTNTSSLDVEIVARATNRAQNVVGMHFFTPAHINPALEVIYCDGTTCPQAVATVVEMGQILEKMPVIMRNGPGFVANRMFRCYLNEALKLLECGYSPQEVDTAFRNFGFAMGPFQICDIIGVETIQRISKEHNWNLSPILGILCEKGRLGRKTSRGFYLYKDNHRHHDPEVDQIIESVRTGQKKSSMTQEEFIRKCLYPYVNEGFNVLNDKIVERPQSIDTMMILGYGWPVSKGGPMFWAQSEGLKNILDYLNGQIRQDKNYPWRPSPLLEKLVKNGTDKLPIDQWIENGSNL